MSTLFGKPSAPALPPPPVAPPPPTVDSASVQAENDADALRRRRGLASTILAGNGASATQPTTSAARLLGS